MRALRTRWGGGGDVGSAFDDAPSIRARAWNFEQSFSTKSTKSFRNFISRIEWTKKVSETLM